MILGLSSADGGMTAGLWKLSSLDGRRPPWYRPSSDLHCFKRDDDHDDGNDYDGKDNRIDNNKSNYNDDDNDNDSDDNDDDNNNKTQQQQHHWHWKAQFYIFYNTLAELWTVSNVQGKAKNMHYQNHMYHSSAT